MHVKSVIYFLFFSLRKKLAYFVTRNVCPSVRPSFRPSSVEITLGRGSDRSAVPIDLKIGINMGNWVIHV